MTDFTELPDLASARAGGRAIEANDEFFAPKENLLKEGRGVFVEGKYTSRGKWMDGWETRRRRTRGHDWCILKLGIPGVLRGVDVDTNHFKGNFPEAFSLDGAWDRGGPWTEILPRTTLQGHAQNLVPVANPFAWSFLRLNIFPDGGVARFRAYGDAVPDWRSVASGGRTLDLAAIQHGGAAIAANDMFFGSRHNLVLPGRAKIMGDGWETKRKRQLPGSDWVIVRLGAPGVVSKIEVDTNHFKGNFPESCAIEGAHSPEGPWSELVPRTKLRAHRRHFFHVGAPDTVSHVRLTIFPDGGVSRLRIHGSLPPHEFSAAVLRRLNALPPDAAARNLAACCGSRRWADEMTRHRPFTDLAASGEAVWDTLSDDDRLEAFAAHPRLGGRTNDRWSAAEQSGAARAPKKTLAALAAGNRAYERKFGRVFLFCATGRSAGDMLSSLQTRLGNDAATELRVASEEQRKILRLRLEKFLAP